MLQKLGIVLCCFPPSIDIPLYLDPVKQKLVHPKANTPKHKTSNTCHVSAGTYSVWLNMAWFVCFSIRSWYRVLSRYGGEKAIMYAVQCPDPYDEEIKQSLHKHIERIEEPPTGQESAVLLHLNFKGHLFEDATLPPKSGNRIKKTHTKEKK